MALVLPKACAIMIEMADSSVSCGGFSIGLRWALFWSLSIHGVWWWDDWLPFSMGSMEVVSSGGGGEPRFDVRLASSRTSSVVSSFSEESQFRTVLPESVNTLRADAGISVQTTPFNPDGEMAEKGKRADPFEDYYPTDKLTRKPHALSDVWVESEGESPLVPAGKVVVRLKVDVQGNVVEAEAERSDFSNEVSALFLDAFRRVRFSPGEIDGSPVAVVIRIEAGYETLNLVDDTITKPVLLGPEK